MKKNILILAVVLIIFAGADCFSQSAETRARELQGTWRVLTFAEMDISEPPLSDFLLFTWTFDGRDYLMKVINNQNGSVEAEGGTFTIVANTIVFSHQDGVVQTGEYAINRNILTISVEGVDFVCRRQ